ncbi:MAG TPA: hypothetical protein ENI87_02650 [bacterium]|nr:hypothetical protein [bacterium]
MQTRLRLIRLMTVARLRAAASPPWLLFGGWVAMAVLQEPKLLRRFGIHLIDDATWTGALFVLVTLLLAEGRRPARCAIAANLTVLFLVSLLMGLVGMLADFGYQAATLGERLWQAASFVVSWAPLAILLTTRFPSGTVRRAILIAVVVMALLLGSMHSVALRTAPEPRVLVAAAAAVIAALSWTLPGRVFIRKPL